MPLPRTVKSIEEVPEAARDFYKESDDGTFLLDAEQAADDAKLAEFRENNRKLKANLDALNKKVQNLPEGADDPDTLKAWQESHKRVQELEGKELLDQGKIDEYLDKRVADMKQKHKTQVEELTRARDTDRERANKLHESLRTNLINSATHTAVLEVGTPRQGAINDILNRATKDFEVDESGQMHPREGLLDSDGNEITDMKAWARNLMQTAPYLFQSGGGGGGGGGDRTGDSRKNAKGVRLLKRGQRMTQQDIKDLADGKATYDDK